MNGRRVLWVVAASIVALGAASAPLRAQWEGLEELPGYFPLDELSLIEADDLTLEINLTAPILRMVAAFAGEQDPELAALVEGLEAVRVRAGELRPGGEGSVGERLRAAGRWLDERGWQPMVRVREAEEEVMIYTRLDASGVVEGMTVLAVESSEVTVVNLIGRLDPAQLGRIIGGLDLDLPGGRVLDGGVADGEEEER
jgi:hypothetical protein